MEGDNSPYFDFSDDDWLMNEFDPGQIDDMILEIHGAQICKHLNVRNPVKGIQGLLGYLIVANAGHLGRICGRLSWLVLLLATNTALLAFFVYKTVM